jgi:putative DNA primase/helicase
MVSRSDAERIAKDIAGIERDKIILMTKFSPAPFTESILKNIDIRYDNHKNLWRYDKEEGIWKAKSEQFLRTLLRTKLLGEEQQKRNYVEEIISDIKDKTFDEEFKVDSNPYYIGFQNKVYNLKEDKFEDFNPNHYLTNKLPISIDEQITECPKIDKFFKECIGEEYKDILYDLIAYCLFKRYPYPKIFFIYGPANTGKSKFLQLLENFLGENNKCSVEPKDIINDMYATSRMEFKMANIVSDIDYSSLNDISQVKKITGEDSVKMRVMYKEPYDSRIFAKQIFSTNKLPIVKEKTKAWYRRVYTIEFSNIIGNDKMDRFLMEKLLEKNELQGLAFKALEKLKELNKHNFTFTYDIDELEMQNIYEELSNPILLFINQSCVLDKNDYVYQWEFKDRLKNWLKINHFPPISKSEINEYMNENYTNSNRSAFNGSKVYRVWSGIGWKSSHNQKNSQEFNHFNHFNGVSKKVYIYRKFFQNPVKSVKMVKSN